MHSHIHAHNHPPPHTHAHTHAQITILLGNNYCADYTFKRCFPAAGRRSQLFQFLFFIFLCKPSVPAQRTTEIAGAYT